MRRLVIDRSFVAVVLASIAIGACAKDPPANSGTGGGTLGGTSGGGSGGNNVGACPDSQEWTPPAAPAACAGAAPAATGAVAATLAVDAGTAVAPWNRFYEKAVAADHAHTLLCTAYGRNAQNALRKAHAQAGFQYVRFHGVFNDDMRVYKVTKK